MELSNLDKQAVKELIQRIGDNEFFINGKGHYRILANDAIAENCKIALYKTNAFHDAIGVMQQAVIKYNAKQSALNELGESLSSIDRGWYQDEVMYIYVPYSFFHLNASSIYCND